MKSEELWWAYFVSHKLIKLVKSEELVVKVWDTVGIWKSYVKVKEELMVLS